MFSPFSSTEASAEEWGPWTSQMGDPQPEATHSLPSAPTPSLIDKELEIEMDVLKQQKTVLHLQEEHYKLKMELLKYNPITNNIFLCLHNIFLMKMLAKVCLFSHDFYITFTVTYMKWKLVNWAL